MRALALTLVTLPLFACGGTIDPGSPSGDGGTATDADASTDTGPDGIFPHPTPTPCQGTHPWIQINGADVPLLSFTRTPVPMNCCISEELDLAVGTMQAPLFFWWEGPMPTTADTVSFDLSNPPPLPSQVEFSIGCDPLKGTCDTAGYNLSGWFSYSSVQPTPSTYCVYGTEKTPTSGGAVHSFAFYVPPP